MNRLVEQFSEIGPLETVLVHRPDVEVAQILPDFFDEMLLDDMPHVPLAQADHDVFVETMRKNGANVLYLSDLFCEAVSDEVVRHAYVEDYIATSHIKGETVKEAVREYLWPMDPATLFRTVSRGILRRDNRYTYSQPPSRLRWKILILLLWIQCPTCILRGMLPSASAQGSLSAP